MKIETRYRYDRVPISIDEAIRWREEELAHIQNQIDALVAEKFELQTRPLPSVRIKQIALEPGDPGYEDAPMALDVVNYQGDFTWQRTQP